jgi:hypothetical protein
MALEMQAVIADFERNDEAPLRLRIGINTGPVVPVLLAQRSLHTTFGGYGQHGKPHGIARFCWANSDNGRDSKISARSI